MASITTNRSYTRLLTSIRREMQRGLVEARRAVERHKVLTYWNIGKTIHFFVDRHVASGGITLFYGRLSADLNINTRTLQQCEQFFRYFPDLKPNGDLSWSHYRHLLRVDDAAQRQRWIKRIKAKNLTTNDVKRALTLFSGRPQPRTAGGKLPEPARGAVYTYRLIPAGKGTGEDYPWYVDCGFKNLYEAPPSQGKPHNRYLYTSVKTKNGYRLRVTDAKTEQLFTFKARLYRVIDGDTLHVVADQGFGFRIKERLRLKGIDAPEINTAAGQRAKLWLSARLKGVPFLIVKTHRTDKYDRYLADVFVPPRPKGAGVTANQIDPQAAAGRGTYLNQELIDAGHAEVYAFE